MALGSIGTGYNFWRRELTRGGLRGLTFELSGRRRQDTRARAEKMYTVPQAGPWWPAVGAPLERRVRPHCMLRAKALTPSGTVTPGLLLSTHT